MKKQTTVFGILTAVLLIGGTVFLTLRELPRFTGGIMKEPDAYRLDAQSMTGADEHTMVLNAGDVLAVRFETEKGVLHLEIQAPDGSVLYSGNGKNTTDFTVSIAESGRYVITVKARSAKGRIQIQAEGQ